MAKVTGEILIDYRQSIYLMHWQDGEATISQYEDNQYQASYGVFPKGSRLLAWDHELEDQRWEHRFLTQDSPEDGGELRYCVFKEERR